MKLNNYEINGYNDVYFLFCLIKRKVKLPPLLPTYKNVDPVYLFFSKSKNNNFYPDLG